MKVKLRLKQMAMAFLLSVATCPKLWAQQPAARYVASPGFGSTVSVAALQVPEKAWRHFVKAKVLAEQNRAAESEVESQKAIAIAPDFANAYLLSASAQVRRHHFEAAISSISEAQRIEPEAMWAHVLLASAYNGLKRYDAADATLNSMHAWEAESWQANYEHARAAIGLLDVAAALRWSDAALQIAPEAFPDAYILRANSLVLARRWNEAAVQMESYLKARGNLEHREEVIVALERTRRKMRDEALNPTVFADKIGMVLNAEGGTSLSGGLAVK